MTILARCSHCSEPFERVFKFCPNCGFSVVGDEFMDKKGVVIHDLFELARGFASISDLDFLLEKISGAAEKLTQSEASSVMLLDDNKEHLYFRTAGGEKGKLMKMIKIPVGQGIAGWVAQHGQPLLIEDVSKDPRFSAALTDQKSGFTTRSILCVPLSVSNEIIGVMEVVNKKENKYGKFSTDDQEILDSLAGFAAVSIINSKLNADQKNFFANMMDILIAAVEIKSKNPAGHCWHVAETSCAIARHLKITGSTYKTIYYASLLHDIGYISAQKQLAAKKMIVTTDKLEQLHPFAGAEVVEPIHLLKDCAPLIRAHHEYWDGSGFPNKLKGEEIPLGARIIAFVEAIEDLRTPFMTEQTYQSQVEQFCTQNAGRFDPQVISAYLAETASAKETQV